MRQYLVTQDIKAIHRNDPPPLTAMINSQQLRAVHITVVIIEAKLLNLVSNKLAQCTHTLNMYTLASSDDS